MFVGVRWERRRREKANPAFDWGDGVGDGDLYDDMASPWEQTEVEVEHHVVGSSDASSEFSPAAGATSTYVGIEIGRGCERAAGNNNGATTHKRTHKSGE